MTHLGMHKSNHSLRHFRKTALRVKTYSIFPVLAKPSGITLEQHTHHVITEGEALISSFAQEKYEGRVHKSLKDRIKLVCRFHDEGKKEAHWQKACQEDFVAYKQNPIGFVADNIRRAGVRHEFYSAREALQNKMPTPLVAAIAAHHGKMNVAYEQRWQSFLDIWKELKAISWENRSFAETANIQYNYSALRSILQYADHRASAKEEGDYVPELKPFSYKFPHVTMRPVQKLIADNWQKDLLLLRAPTGAGKTDASLLWAQLQIEHQRADRLVIAMPTRFTSNALSISVAESLSDTGLYHSSAWFNKYHQNVKDGNNELIKAKKEHELARLLETPVTVCTIDHLLMALTLTREDHHLITFNLANSCLVIDEADFYDEFTQANIKVLLKALKEWNVPVLLMSASLPESVLKDYQSIGYDVDEILTDHSDEERYRFEIKDIIDYSTVDELDHVLELMMKKGIGIIYANTIDKAFEFASWFQNRNFTDIIVYHSRFTEPDKQAKETKLIDALGKDAWREGHAHGIAIMTQIGEMSINISADIMISDLCPIDRLTQRAGRLCRFNKEQIGELYVVRPHKDGALYPAPYGTPNKNEKTWEVCEALKLTNQMIEKKKYNSKELLVLLNNVYYKNSDFDVKSRENAKHLEEYFMFKWLIGSKERTKEDDTSNQFWKSRDILPQESVFVMKPGNPHFKNWHDFQEYKILSSMDIPSFLIQKAQKSHIVDSVEISIGIDSKEYIYVIREGFYNETFGLTISINNGSNFL